MATFALVHGAFCGAWCWEQVRPRLEGRGHVVVAMDLPCDQPSAGCVRYAKTVIDSLAKHPEPVVLVGHSLGGLTIPLVAAARPVERAGAVGHAGDRATGRAYADDQQARRAGGGARCVPGRGAAADEARLEECSDGKGAGG